VQCAEISRGESFLLVAHPSLDDSNFGQSVVAVTYPEKESGPIGVIINKPTTKRLKDLLSGQPRLEGRTDFVHFGGPVRIDQLCFIFRSASPDSRALQLIEDVYFSGDLGILDDLINKTSDPVDQRMYVGYSSWARGQLEYEIAAGAWYVLPMDKDLLFTTQYRSLWRDLLLRARAIQVLAIQGMVGVRE
jgi:putative transcriptional regulator